MKVLFFSILLITLFSCQTNINSRFAGQINEYRENYKKEFLHTDRNPLEMEDLQHLDFYPPDKACMVKARVELLNQQDTLVMKTSSGKFKKYIPFALLKFSLDGQALRLFAYSSIDLKENELYKDYLFVPFTDATNGTTTYGGGRYIDLNKNDIRNHRIRLDFNKAYNPWCAFSYGYNCPVPPKENDLPIEIRAGEKNFRAPVKKK